MSDFSYDGILHGAGHVDGALEALLDASSGAVQDKEGGLKLPAAVGTLIKRQGGGEHHCTL